MAAEVYRGGSRYAIAAPALKEYKQHALADRLLADLGAWELARRLRAYLIVLRTRVEAVTDPDEQAAATEWLAWCEKYAADHDPTTKQIAMPTVRPPGYSELAEVRKRLGFSMF